MADLMWQFGWVTAPRCVVKQRLRFPGEEAILPQVCKVTMYSPRPLEQRHIAYIKGLFNIQKVTLACYYASIVTI